MPIYEFECAACGARTDELMKASDPDPTTCPKCGKEALRRLLSAPSFRLSGSGWYETDFKSDKDKKRNLAGDGGSSDSGSDSAAATKSDAAKSDTPAKTESTTAKSDATPAAKPAPSSTPSGSSNAT